MEKEPIKIKLSTILLMFAVAVIIVMAVIIGIIYKQNMNNRVINSESNNQNSMIGENAISNNTNVENEISKTEKNFSESEIKKSFEDFLNLFGAYQGSPYSVLDEMKKITGKNVIDDEYPNSNIKYNDGYILRTNIKYSEFKEFMLNYMTEELFNTDFARGYVNKDGDLYCKEIGASGIEYEVISIEKMNNSNTKYRGKVFWVYDEEDKEEGNILFEIASNNGKCVISSITLPGEMQDDDNDEPQTSKTSNIDWEKYPSNIDNQNKKWLGYDDLNGVSYKLMKKTIYSLSKINEESFTDMYYCNLGIGDSTKIIDWRSNYARYCYPNNENNDLSANYTKKITYDIAEFNESYYDGYYDLATCVKNQYDSLASNNYYYKVPKMLIMNGNNESEENYKNNARAKKIKVTLNKDKQYIFNLKDTNKVQIFDIGYKQNNIKTPVNIEVEVLEKYNGEKTNDVYISDIQFSIDSNIPQGR